LLSYTGVRRTLNPPLSADSQITTSESFTQLPIPMVVTFHNLKIMVIEGPMGIKFAFE